MAKFIEITRNNPREKLLINFEHVVVVKTFARQGSEAKALITYAVATGESQTLENVYVTETYAEVKRLLDA